jgi:hypothetical protein
VGFLLSGILVWNGVLESKKRHVGTTIFADSSDFRSEAVELETPCGFDILAPALPVLTTTNGKRHGQRVGAQTRG